MQRSFVTRWTALTVAIVAALFSTAAGAQAFPSKPVRFIVPFPPGGSSDGSARIVAEKLSEEWKQPVIVENRPGAGTTIAAAFVASAPADGYTLLSVGPGSHIVSSLLYKNLSYHGEKSFTPVGQVASAPFVVVVTASSPVKSLQELLQLAKTKPGGISYSSSGSGATPHLATEIMSQATGVKFLHVPYKGGAPATIAVLAGEVDFSTADASAIPHIQSGKLRALGITTARRSSLFPGVPPLAEVGATGMDVPLASGVLAPAGVPKDVVQRISASIVRLANSDDVKKRLVPLGFEADPKNSDEFAAFMASEFRKYTKIVNAIGLKLD